MFVMKVEVTQRELNELIESVLLEAGEVTITPKGRNIIGLFLMLLGGALTPLPLVGWVVGPTIAFLSKMGILEDYVADYIQGRTNLEGLVDSIEKRVSQILMATPKGRAVIGHLALLAIKSDPTGQMQSQVQNIVSAEAATPEGVLGVTPKHEIEKLVQVKLAAIYITDAILQMVQKNIKLKALTIRGKKVKIPGQKLLGDAGGLIKIDKKDLPVRYQPLHGIINQIADPAMDSAGAQAFEVAVEVADNDEADLASFELTGDIEGTPDIISKSLKSTDILNPYDPDTPGGPLAELFDTVDMIEMINEIRYSKVGK